MALHSDASGSSLPPNGGDNPLSPLLKIVIKGFFKPLYSALVSFNDERFIKILLYHSNLFFGGYRLDIIYYVLRHRSRYMTPNAKIIKNLSYRKYRSDIKYIIKNFGFDQKLFCTESLSPSNSALESCKLGQSFIDIEFNESYESEKSELLEFKIEKYNEKVKELLLADENKSMYKESLTKEIDSKFKVASLKQFAFNNKLVSYKKMPFDKDSIINGSILHFGAFPDIKMKEAFTYLSSKKDDKGKAKVIYESVIDVDNMKTLYISDLKNLDINSETDISLDDKSKEFGSLINSKKEISGLDGEIMSYKSMMREISYSALKRRKKDEKTLKSGRSVEYTDEELHNMKMEDLISAAEFSKDRIFGKIQHFKDSDKDGFTKYVTSKKNKVLEFQDKIINGEFNKSWYNYYEVLRDTKVLSSEGDKIIENRRKANKVSGGEEGVLERVNKKIERIKSSTEEHLVKVNSVINKVKEDFKISELKRITRLRNKKNKNKEKNKSKKKIEEGLESSKMQEEEMKDEDILNNIKVPNDIFYKGGFFTPIKKITKALNYHHFLLKSTVMGRHSPSIMDKKHNICFWFLHTPRNIENAVWEEKERGKRKKENFLNKRKAKGNEAIKELIDVLGIMFLTKVLNVALENDKKWIELKNEIKIMLENLDFLIDYLK